MKNEIYVNDQLVTSETPKSKFKNGFKIRCTSCKDLVCRKWFDNNVLERSYICKSCVLRFSNPMHDVKIRKKHKKIVTSDEYRKKLSNICSGEKNGFFGKSHSKKTIEVIKNANIEYNQNLTEDDRKKRSKRLSEAQKKIQKKDPKYYSEIKSKAASISNRKQLSNSTPNKIETIVQKYIKNDGYEFSVILDKYQFDFGNRDKKILIEVFGDYWHGNPDLYESFSEVQNKVKNRDLEKLKFALKNGFKVYVLWEQEILNGSFKNKIRDLI